MLQPRETAAALGLALLLLAPGCSEAPDAPPPAPAPPAAVSAKAGPAPAPAAASFDWSPANALRTFSQQEIREIANLEGGPILVDARSAREHAEGHIPGTDLNIPHKETWGRIGEVEPYRERGIIYYCTKGGRAKIAADGLLLEGFRKVGVVNGHFSGWTAAGLPVETGP